VLNPQAVVLVSIEAGHQGPLKAVHDLTLVSIGKISLRKRQNAAGVGLGIATGVDQFPCLLGVASQRFGTFPVAILA